MHELNAYQQDLIARLHGEGRVELARKVYTGWLNGINESIPALSSNGRSKQRPLLRAPVRRSLTSHRFAFA